MAVRVVGKGQWARAMAEGQGHLGKGSGARAVGKGLWGKNSIKCTRISTLFDFKQSFF